MGANEGAIRYSGKALFNRTERLVGAAGMQRLAGTRVLILGLGGVGSWCAESLVRTGVGHLSLVDSDRVCVTNINRQLQATCETVGEVKVEALRQRLLSIHPAVEVVAHQKIYHEATAGDFDLDTFDVIVDAIDSVSNKMLLLHRASQSSAAVFCSLGAACKLDPTRIRTAEFMHVKGCPLGAKLRKQMRRTGMLPVKPILTVYSDEVLENSGATPACGSAQCLCPQGQAGPGDPGLVNHEWCSQKAVINGSVAHITGIFGFTLAGLVVQHVLGQRV
ncbi:MAG: ThiF family adenylyltransferase [Kiritimatiellia bacterium]